MSGQICARPRFPGSPAWFAADSQLSDGAHTGVRLFLQEGKDRPDCGEVRNEKLGMAGFEFCQRISRAGDGDCVRACRSPVDDIKRCVTEDEGRLHRLRRDMPDAPIHARADQVRVILDYSIQRSRNSLNQRLAAWFRLPWPCAPGSRREKTGEPACRDSAAPTAGTALPPKSRN
ncbi:MAG: hypothetical protein H6Q05_695 [Acidobacteria bacterium]|nr:hypothetical protein [Acidobacteriota bacterium]